MNESTTKSSTSPRWPHRVKHLPSLGYVVWRDVFEGREPGSLEDRVLAHKQAVFVCESDAVLYSEFRNAMTAAHGTDDPAAIEVAALASAPAATQGEAVSPMAKMAQALRGKALAERAAFDTRVQSGEWGPMPDAGTEADCPNAHVATIEGDDAVRQMRWNPNVAAFDYEVGTKLYAAPTPQPTAPARAAEATQAAIRAGYKLVPMIPNADMNRVMDSEGWAWEDLLAAACAITEDEYEQIAGSGTFQPAQPAAAEQAVVCKDCRGGGYILSGGKLGLVVRIECERCGGTGTMVPPPPSQAPAGAIPSADEMAKQIRWIGSTSADRLAEQLVEWLAKRAPAGVEAAQQGQEDIAELRRLSSVCPELNLSNYGPDDVDELNGWAIEVAQCIDRAFPIAQKSHLQEGRMP